MSAPFRKNFHGSACLNHLLPPSGMDLARTWGTHLSSVLLKVLTFSTKNHSRNTGRLAFLDPVVGAPQQIRGQTGEESTAKVHEYHSVNCPTALASNQAQTFATTSAQPGGSPPGVCTQGEAMLSQVSAGSSTLLFLPAGQDWQGRQSSRSRTVGSCCRNEGQALGTYKYQVPSRVLCKYCSIQYMV